MNWRQLYTICTPEERGEITTLILERIEARRDQVLQARIESLKLSKGRTLPERRELLGWAHFIGMRPSMSRRTRTLYRSLFLFILGTVSFTIGMIAPAVHPSVGAPLVFVYAVFLLLILLIKPFRLRKQVAVFYR